MEAQHPDDFVLSLLETFPDVVEAARNHRVNLEESTKNTRGVPRRNARARPSEERERDS
jgi:hypothetical protein